MTEQQGAETLLSVQEEATDISLWEVTGKMAIPPKPLLSADNVPGQFQGSTFRSNHYGCDLSEMGGS